VGEEEKTEEEPQINTENADQDKQQEFNFFFLV
jgi:hypothetical protein